MDIDLDIVRPMHQNGRFFKDEFGRDQIEISFVGSKDTLIKDVSPQIMAQFRSEWDAYCDGRPVERMDDLLRLMVGDAVGVAVTLGIVRAGRPIEIAVVPAELAA